MNEPHNVMKRLGEDQEFPEMKRERTSVVEVAQGLCSRGAVTSAILLLSELESPAEEESLLLVDCYLKLMDLLKANKVLSDVPVEKSEPQRRLLSSLTKQQFTAAQWDILVTSQLGSINSFDQTSWRILQGNLYSRAYYYMVRSWETCDFFYQRFIKEVERYNNDNLVNSFCLDKIKADIVQIEETIDAAMRNYHQFKRRLMGIFQYLDRYHLRTRMLPKLNEVCSRAFLFCYFRKAVLPVITAMWVSSLKDSPALLSESQSMLIRYSLEPESHFQVLSQRVRDKQSVLSLRSKLPNEMLKLILDFMV